MAALYVFRNLRAEEKLASYEKVIVPANDGCHWYLVIVSFTKVATKVATKVVTQVSLKVADSLRTEAGTLAPKQRKRCKDLTECIEYCASLESMQVQMIEKADLLSDTPQQSDSSSCGIIMLKTMEQITRGKSLKFAVAANDLSKYRGEMQKVTHTHTYTYL